MIEKLVLNHIIDKESIPYAPKDVLIKLKKYKDIKYFEEFRKENIRITKEKVKASVKNDIFIVQCINSIDELTKAINMHTKRLREWSAYPFPELSESIEDNVIFVETIINFTGPKEEDMMSIKLEKKHFEPIKNYASMIIRMIEERKLHEEYLEIIMKELCPNTAELAGVQIGARLIALAGNLERLAMSPASKIQLLGAEVALFRHLKTGARSPKHGIIHEHQFVNSARREDKGKNARRLADKISLAVKVDFFKGEYIADKLKKELE